MLIEHPHGEEVADLEDEATGFLKQRCLSIADMLPKNDGALLTRKMRSQIRKGFSRVLGQLGYRASQLVGGLKSLIQDDVIDRQGKKCVGLAAQVGDAIFDLSLIHI